MGFLAHHAIIVTSAGYPEADAALEVARKFALSLEINREFGGTPMPVTEIVPGVINGHSSFAVLPDGSSEGWATSDEADVARELIIQHLESTRYDDGSGPLSWVEVCFGGDLDAATIETDSCASPSPA